MIVPVISLVGSLLTDHLVGGQTSAMAVGGNAATGYTLQPGNRNMTMAGVPILANVTTTTTTTRPQSNSGADLPCSITFVVLLLLCYTIIFEKYSRR